MKDKSKLFGMFASSVLEGFKGNDVVVNFFRKPTSEQYKAYGVKFKSFLGSSSVLMPPFLQTTEGADNLFKQIHENRAITQVFFKTEKITQESMLVNNYRPNKSGGMSGAEIMVIPGSHEPRVVSTTDPNVHEALREQRNVKSKKHVAQNSTMPLTVVGGLRVDSFGPYFGGNPTIIGWRDFKEQIYPDATLMTAKDITTYREFREEVDSHGPRISGSKKIELCKTENGKYISRILEDCAFVNSTIHRGMRRGPDGKLYPVTSYTPGSSLLSLSKIRVSELKDGSTIQTLTTAITASADVLCHWMLRGCKSITNIAGLDVTGITNTYSNSGTVDSVIAHAGVGNEIVRLGLLATGVPFDMTTLTIHRSPEGEPLHLMVNKRTKPWPANETILELTGANGETQFTYYDSIIPSMGTTKDLTVTKLLTPVANESTITFAINGGKLTKITDQEVKKAMSAENEKGRYTLKELQECEGVPPSMLLSASGLTKTDTRSRVTMLSKTGQFDIDRVAQFHTGKDPQTMEIYFCGRAARLLSERISSYIHKNHSHWEKNPALQNLWDIITSATPTFEELNAAVQTNEKTIQQIMSSEDVHLIRENLEMARNAYSTLENLKSHFPHPQ